MAGKQNVRAEIEEQRCLIEQQQVEILRQRHQLEMQRRHVAHLEAELESVKIIFQRSGLAIQPATNLPATERQRPPRRPSVWPRNGVIAII